MLSPMSLAKELLKEEERAKKQKKEFEKLRKDIVSGIVEGITKIRFPEQVIKGNFFYQTGEIEAPVADYKDIGNYDFHDLFFKLGYPATEGSIINAGPRPGNIYVLIGKSQTKISDKEIKLPPYYELEWTTDDRYEIYHVYVRTDTAGTKYQILAG